MNRSTWAAAWWHQLSINAVSFPMKRRLYVPATPLAKICALRRYARDHGIHTFVETGTHVGRTVAALAGGFHHRIMIEMSPAFHAQASARFHDVPHVECMLGDSTMVLPEVIRNLAQPALFWLDAHASGGSTVNSGRGPIMAELGAIFRSAIRGHVVLIDDARGHDVDQIRRSVPPFMHCAVRNDIIRIVPVR